MIKKMKAIIAYKVIEYFKPDNTITIYTLEAECRRLLII